MTTGDFYALQERLLSSGFGYDREAKIISRYLYGGVKVDLMPTDPSILGFTNPWYKEGVRKGLEND